MKTKEEIISTISKVKHPAIDFSLLELGIVKDIEITENNVKVCFAFPFPGIPIAEMLINSIATPVKAMGLNFEYTVVDMTEEEKLKFLDMENKAWKG
ncbi:MAG: DUF59 domain-containing protein [Bacteroidales bacterium]|nr:DUF59 domain-containing protein [Bacteroidales bacterium]